MSAIPTEAEIRLRLVEALTRSDGSAARQRPEEFVAAVAKIETYVVNGMTTEKPKPEPEAPPAPQRKGKGVKAEKDTASGEPDFM